MTLNVFAKQGYEGRGDGHRNTPSSAVRFPGRAPLSSEARDLVFYVAGPG